MRTLDKSNYAIPSAGAGRTQRSKPPISARRRPSELARDFRPTAPPPVPSVVLRAECGSESIASLPLQAREAVVHQGSHGRRGSDRDHGGLPRVVTNPLGGDALHHAAIFASLPRREREVCRYLLTGLAEKQIAAAINLSHHTVHVYIKSVYRRFGVRSRPELMAIWIYSAHGPP